MKSTTLFLVAGVFIGCSNDPYEPSAPAFDGDAPRVHIEWPARGTFTGDIKNVLVTGTVSDDSGRVASVTVNGVPAAIADDGTWLANVPVVPGTNLLRAIAVDTRHNQSTETRAVVVGPMVALDRHITSGIRATVSAPALTTLGRDTTSFIKAGGLMTAAQGMNPVVDARSSECQYARASITSLTVGDADVQMAPARNGIAVTAVVDNANIGTHLQWADGCTEGNSDVVLSAQRVTVQGRLAVDVVNHKLDIRLEDQIVEITGFDPQLPDVPANIVQMLALDSAANGVVRSLSARLVVPMVDRTLAGLTDTRTIDVAGVAVDIAVEPTQVDFTPDGGTIVLDTSLRAHGDNGQFVFVPNVAPVLDSGHGFDLALADDAANQLLTSMWSAGAFDATIDLSGSGTLGKLYDSVQLHLVVPPHVEATGSPLQLSVGDWIATFKLDDAIATTVAIHAKSALYATAGDGTLRMGVSAPAVDVDVVDGVDSITKLEYQAIKSFALERVQTLGSAAIGASPLPAIGNAKPTTPWVDPRAGYLLVAGDVE
jgi:hypothetical protein